VKLFLNETREVDREASVCMKARVILFSNYGEWTAGCKGPYSSMEVSSELHDLAALPP
jgi:hypothetical protein